MQLTRQQSREIDKLAIERYGFTGLVLMENAGRGVVDLLREIAPTASVFAILCGKGNNAGDGFVIARHLEIHGVNVKIDVKVVLLAPPDELRGDALSNFEILQNTDIPIVDLSGVADLKSALSTVAGDATWLIDAMLGTGADGEPREPYATAIDWMNAQTAVRLAIDVPSGLDCDTGVPSPHTICAHHTCTFVAPKVGFQQPAASECLGELHVVGIGTPPRLLAEVIDSVSPF